MKNTKNKGSALLETLLSIALKFTIFSMLLPLLPMFEYSSIQNDTKAMNDVVTAVQLALADQKVYDEVVANSCYGNYSSYVDSDSEIGRAKFVTVTQFVDNDKNYKEQYVFGDETRETKGKNYYFAGNMLGMTISFTPESVQGQDGSLILLANGVVNKGLYDTVKVVREGREADDVEYTGTYVPKEKADRYFSSMHTADARNQSLYKAVTTRVKDKVKIESTKYKNSDFTVFIQLKEDMKVDVYGQWSGEYLLSKDVKA